ncbi:hypothetical protein IEE_05477 [Bacillus cereus BAG5X1-1]|uniref:Uncharacterized protein n=1 Tax=Bacillus cereus BAG5X1-1 TaxID=1053189 RepID=J7ZHU8_BACCE|nr:DUF5592 family protein [Bacillus cereus]EJQ36001.1 hypothetical protein IEE_05477 [Bacillus cereus BAG5X1-1]
MMRNPKNVKQEIKLSFFYLIDAGIIAMMLILANYVTKIVPMGGVASIVLHVTFAVFGLFLCIRPFNSPTNRNVKVIWKMLKMDNKNYHPIDVDTISSASKRK